MTTTTTAHYHDTGRLSDPINFTCLDLRIFIELS